MNCSDVVVFVGFPIAVVQRLKASVYDLEFKDEWLYVYVCLEPKGILLKGC